jgi:GT2 family glycosyltransferase
MKVSWVILTYNRFSVVSKAFRHNMLNAGLSAHEQSDVEIIWVDNGSKLDDQSCQYLQHLSDVKVFNKVNLGVAKGYNRGMVLATGDLVVITGCDRIMPENWLRRMLEAFEKVPNMGCVSCYSHPDHMIQDRYLTNNKVEEVGGVQFMRALPFEARMFRRSMLSDVGYFHEGFGLYGYEDCLWGPRFVNEARAKGLICCTLPDFKAKHLGDAEDSPQYKEFKKKENQEAWKWELVEELARQGYPKFNPYL